MTIKTLLTHWTFVLAAITPLQQATASTQEATMKTLRLGLDCIHDPVIEDSSITEACKMDGFNFENPKAHYDWTDLHLGKTDTPEKYKAIELEQRLRDTANKVANHQHYGHVAWNVGENVMDDLKQQAWDFTTNSNWVKVMINWNDIRYVPNSMNPSAYKLTDTIEEQSNQLYTDND